MKYLNINQLSELLGNRSVCAIYEDVKLGNLPPPIKLGNRNYWSEDKVAAHLEALAETQQGGAA